MLTNHRVGGSEGCSMSGRMGLDYIILCEEEHNRFQLDLRYNVGVFI